MGFPWGRPVGGRREDGPLGYLGKLWESIDPVEFAKLTMTEHKAQVSTWSRNCGNEYLTHPGPVSVPGGHTREPTESWGTLVRNALSENLSPRCCGGTPAAGVFQRK